MARTVQRLSDDQRELVAQLEAAADARRAADETYRAAMLRARDQGVSYTAIAHAVGVRPETARLYIERHADE